MGRPCFHWPGRESNLETLLSARIRTVWSLRESISASSAATMDPPNAKFPTLQKRGERTGEDMLALIRAARVNGRTGGENARLVPRPARGAESPIRWRAPPAQPAPRVRAFTRSLVTRRASGCPVGDVYPPVFRSARTFLRTLTHTHRNTHTHIEKCFLKITKSLRSKNGSFSFRKCKT